LAVHSRSCSRGAFAQLLRRAHPDRAAAPRKLPARLRRAGCAALAARSCFSLAAGALRRGPAGPRRVEARARDLHRALAAHRRVA